MHWKTIVLLTVFAAIVPHTSGHCGPCQYILYPENFNPANYTFPNSVCIYPDGRTSLANAVRGNLCLNIDRLQRLGGDGQYYYYDWPDHGLLLGDASTNLAVCDSLAAPAFVYGLPYLRHTGEMWGFCAVPIYGGGHSAVDGSGQPIASAVLYWLPLDSECGGVDHLELYFNSPDITGDLVVNLSDIACFMTDRYGAYNYRSDFNWDTFVNLSDQIIMVDALYSSCP